jgi:hypothetical protein
MALEPARPGDDDAPMLERERRLIEGAGPDASARRARASEHPLLFLQRTAGNAAVSRLVAGMTVQRDDDDEPLVPELPGPEEPELPWPEVKPEAPKPLVPELPGPEEGPEGPEPEGPEGPAPEEPEPMGPEPMGPEGAPLPNPKALVTWMASVKPHQLQVRIATSDSGAMVEASQEVVAEYARSLPYEPIPTDQTAAMGFMYADGTEVVGAPDVVSGQLFRYWAGMPSPDVERIMNEGRTPAPGGGLSPVPGGGPPGPGGGPVGPGGIGPVTPGGGGGSIPGMEPLPPGGGGAPGGIPGTEPVPPGGGGAPGGIPGLEPVPPGGGAGPAPTGARPMLRRGSTGEDVREAQGLLIRHGATITPDGQFGPATQRAVIDFQRSAGLTPDGIVGPRTWSALEAG